MKMEEKLSQTMKRATADEPLPADVWEGFQRRASRSQQTRLAVSAGGLAVLIALAAVIVPRLGNSTPGLGTAGAPPADWVSYTNPEVGYELKHPKGWLEIGSGKTFDLQPGDLSKERNGGFTFMTFRLYERVSLNESVAGSRSPLGTKTTGIINGKGFMRFVKLEGNPQVTYRIAWSESSTLSVMLSLADRSLYNSYHAAAEEVVRSIEDCDCLDPTSIWQSHVEMAGSWSIKYPQDWKYGLWEGYSEVEPSELSSLAKGDATFAISLFVEPGRYDKDAIACDGSNASTCTAYHSSEDLFDGRSFIETDEPTRISYRVDWGTPSAPRTLLVTMQATSADLWDQYLKTGNQVLRTIHHL